MLLINIKCPYCGETECFFVNGGAIYRHEKEGRARLRLACRKCCGEFAYIEEGESVEYFNLVEPPKENLTACIHQ